ncbi:MAG: prepilin-type N-terminal cleavage/methylation domain-containing protein [Thermodesulfobacteriota bacterium]
MRKNGFSLLELIMAMGILAFGFFSLFHLSLSTRKADLCCQNRTAALQLAQEKMELLKTLPFSDIKGEGESGLTNGTIGTVFERETKVDKDLTACCADVTVRVCWPSTPGLSPDRCAEISTKIAA